MGLKNARLVMRWCLFAPIHTSNSTHLNQRYQQVNTINNGTMDDSTTRQRGTSSLLPRGRSPSGTSSSECDKFTNSQAMMCHKCDSGAIALSHVIGSQRCSGASVIKAHSTTEVGQWLWHTCQIGRCSRVKEMIIYITSRPARPTGEVRGNGRLGAVLFQLSEHWRENCGQSIGLTVFQKLLLGDRSHTICLVYKSYDRGKFHKTRVRDILYGGAIPHLILRSGRRRQTGDIVVWGVYFCNLNLSKDDLYRSSLDHFSDFLLAKYQIENLMQIVKIDVLKAISNMAPDNPLIAIFGSILAGSMDPIVMRYVYLLNEILLHLDLACTLDLRPLFIVLYRHLADEDIDPHVLSYSSYSNNKISPALVSRYLMSCIVRDREPRIVECAGKLRAFTTGDPNNMKAHEFNSVMETVYPLATNKIKDHYFRVSEMNSGDDSGRVRTPLLGQVVAFLLLKDSYPKVVADINDKIHHFRHKIPTEMVEAGLRSRQNMPVVEIPSFERSKKQLSCINKAARELSREGLWGYNLYDGAYPILTVLSDRVGGARQDIKGFFDDIRVKPLQFYLTKHSRTPFQGSVRSGSDCILGRIWHHQLKVQYLTTYDAVTDLIRKYWSLIG
eukprot:sb/3463104/